MDPKPSSAIDEQALASFNPNGLKALLVDHTPTSLFLLAKMLQTLHYQVTTCPWPTKALSMIKNGVNKFDIVITELHFSSGITGIQFLETLIRETDLPVVIVSSDDRNDVIIECVKKGACAYYPKPVRMDVARLLWQHVARKEVVRCFRPVKQVSDAADSSSSGEDKEFCGSSDGFSDHRKNFREDEQDKVEGKKRRMVWTDELHQQFLDAVKQLGLNNAVPKKVLELMNVPGLTRENVASHLQKYRLSLQKQTNHTRESFPATNAGTGVPVQGAGLGHYGIAEPLPPDQFSMDLIANPMFISNNTFHDPDHYSGVLFPAGRDFSGRYTPPASITSNGYEEAMQFVGQPTNDEDLGFNTFDEITNE